MQTIVRHQDGFPMLSLTLEPGEGVLAEAGAMVARDPAVRLEIALAVGRDRGFWARVRALVAAVIRKMVGGEHLLVNRFAAPASGGWVWVAPAFTGELVTLDVAEGATWTLSPGAFVACDPGVHLQVEWAGWSAMFSRDAVFRLAVRGAGRVWIAGRGAIDRIEVDGAHVVDAGHLVGFGPGLTARPRGGHRGGHRDGKGAARAESDVVEITGRGTVLVQARSHAALIGYLTPLLPE